MQKRYYLAYGSNLNIPQMRLRCPESRVVGTAMLEGWELLFKGSKTGAYLTIEPKAGCAVPGAVWEVSPSDERRLDRYEGYPNFYYKKELDVEFKGIVSSKTRRRRAFAYIMHEDRPVCIPSQYYLEVCAEGYESFGFDLAPLADAYQRSMEGAQ